MLRSSFKFIVFFLVLTLSGSMLYEGLHALSLNGTVSDGLQLGRWAQLFLALEINPQGGFVQAIFIIWGVWGLWALSLFTFNFWGSRWNLFFFCLCSLWYMSFGTTLAILSLLLLFFMGNEVKDSELSSLFN